MKRSKYRFNSTALCHGWKANVVHHMYQKFVLKNDRLNTSSIRFVPRDASDAAMIAIKSNRSLLLSPMADASIFRPSLTNLAWE